MKTDHLRILFIISLLCSSILLNAQEKDKSNKSIHLGIGTSHFSLQDKVFSPLVYRGSGIAFDLGYQSKKDQLRHFANLNYSSAKLNPSLNNESNSSIQNTVFTLDYEFTKRIASHKFKYFLGGGIYNFGSIRNVSFIFNDDISLDIFSSINLVSSVTRSLGKKHHFSFTLSYPLLSYVVGKMRVPLDFPPEVLQAVLDDPDNFPLGSYLRTGNLHSFIDFIDLRTRFEYMYQASNHWNIGFVYNFRYYRYKKYLDIKNGSSQFNFVLSYIF